MALGHTLMGLQHGEKIPHPKSGFSFSLVDIKISTIGVELCDLVKNPRDIDHSAKYHNHSYCEALPETYSKKIIHCFSRKKAKF